MPSKRRDNTVEAEVTRARNFAISAHGNQRYGLKPYIYHLDAVHTIVTTMKCEPTCRVLAYLHDVAEDTKVPVEGIRAAFGGPMADLVCLVTDEPMFDRETRKYFTNAKLKATGDNEEYQPALIVKLADRLANVRESVATENARMFKLYQQENATFLDAVRRSHNENHSLIAALNQAFNEGNLKGFALRGTY